METIGSSIEFQMSLLLFAALAGHILALGLHQPAVVGEILMGLLLGPSVLGWVTYTGFVSEIAQLGAIALLFVVGLQFSLGDIVTPENALIGLFGVVVSFCGGFWLAIAFGFDARHATLIGVALAATSIAITADVLRELGQSDSVAAKVVIGSAVLGNLIALLAISATRQQAAGDGFNPLQALWLVATGLLFFVAAAVVGRLILARWIQFLDRTPIAGRYPQFVFIFAMLVAFAYAMFAERFGLSAILGAFLAGISLEGIELRISRRFTEGADYLRILFGSVFFVSLGILADLRTFTIGEVTFMLLLTLVAMAGKLIGCGLPGWWLGKRFDRAMVVGLGMVPRGEVAMVIALFALNDGLIGQSAYASLILMSLLTMVVAPILLKGWLSQDRE